MEAIQISIAFFVCGTVVLHFSTSTNETDLKQTPYSMHKGCEVSSFGRIKKKIVPTLYIKRAVCLTVCESLEGFK